MSPLQHTKQTGRPRARGMFTGRVLSNAPICPEHYRILIGLANFPPSRPGQFVNIQCNGGKKGTGVFFSVKKKTFFTEKKTPVPFFPETVGRVPLLRRPFSLAGRADKPDGSVELDILYRVVGAGTAWMAGLETGAEIDLIGPLGNGFAIREDKSLAAVIGGGTGIGPMIYLGRALASAGKDVSVFAGARTASAMPLTEEQKGTFTITTDDGSLGKAGMVHEAFSRWIEREKPPPARHERDRMVNMVVYACGPEPMMKAIADICIPSGIECQLALERHMACGMGVCQGCAIKIKTDEPPGWMFKLVCKDGPVFDAEVILWE